MITSLNALSWWLICLFLINSRYFKTIKSGPATCPPTDTIDPGTFLILMSYFRGIAYSALSVLGPIPLRYRNNTILIFETISNAA